MVLEQLDDFEQFASDLSGYIHSARVELMHQLQDLGLQEVFTIIANSRVDHICIRVGWGDNGEYDFSRYTDVRDSFANKGEVLLETIIPPSSGGRPITIVELDNPISDFEVCHLEVPAPRFGKVEQEGIDHIEMVLPNQYSLGVLLENYGTSLVQRGIVTHERYFEAISAQLANTWNADLVIEINDFKIKLHEQHIKEVVEYEKILFDLDGLHAAFRRAFPGVMLEG